MAEAELVGYTEEELYVVPKKENKAQPEKVCHLQPATISVPEKTNFYKVNKGLLIAITIALVSLGIYLYYQHQKDKEKRKSS